MLNFSYYNKCVCSFVFCWYKRICAIVMLFVFSKERHLFVFCVIKFD